MNLLAACASRQKFEFSLWALSLLKVTPESFWGQQQGGCELSLSPCKVSVRLPGCFLLPGMSQSSHRGFNPAVKLCRSKFGNWEEFVMGWVRCQGHREVSEAGVQKQLVQF